MSVNIRYVDSTLLLPEGKSLEDIQGEIDHLMGGRYYTASLWTNLDKGKQLVEVVDREECDYPNEDMSLDFNEELKAFTALFAEGSTLTYLDEDDICFYRAYSRGGGKVDLASWLPCYTSDIPFPSDGDLLR